MAWASPWALAQGTLTLYSVPSDVVVTCTQVPAAAVVTAYSTCGVTNPPPPPAPTGTVIGFARVAWFASSGFLDPDNPTQPLLSPPIQSTIIQLVSAGSNGVIDAVDLGGFQWAGGDDRVLQQVLFVSTVDNGFTEYAAGTFGDYTQALTGPLVFYARIFQDATPQQGERYYNSLTAAAIAVTPPAAQFFDMNQDVSNGDQLTQVIGESSTTNGSPGEVPVQFVESITGSCPLIIWRTWSASNACGETVVATQKITVADSAPPQLVAPSDVAVPCASSTSPSNTGVATATDACDAGPVVVYTDVTNGTCPGLIVRTWRATDDCGNTTSRVQNITLTDGGTTNGSFLLVIPSNITVQCGGSTLPGDTGVAEVLGGCPPPTGGVLTAQFADVLSTSSCPRFIDRVWSVTDGCSNYIVATQRVTVVDSVAPVLQGVPGDIQVHCGSVPLPATVTAIDSCGGSGVSISNNGLALYYSFDEFTNNTVLDLSGNGRNGSLHGVTFEPNGKFGGAARCGGSNWINGGSTLDLVNGITALTACVWIKTPSNTSGSCVLGKQTDNANDGYRGWALRIQGDHAEGDLVAVFFGERAHPVDVTAITDNQWHMLAGVFAVSAGSMNATLYVDGVFKSSVTSSPITASTVTTADLRLGNRGPIGSDWYTGLLDDARVFTRALSRTEISNLFVGAAVGGDLPVQFVETTSGICPKVITRIWSAADACNNSVTATQKITVVDTQAPVLVGVPPDLVINCGPIPTSTVTATDCNAATVTVGVVTNGDCPGQVTRTWTATDACGNTAVATQKISLIEGLLDSDGDGLYDGEEIQRGTDPFLADTDGDGRDDGFEVAKGTDPLSPSSFTRYVKHDFDGDGIADVSTYDPASGVWSILFSGGGSTQRVWGGGVAVPQDYDNDGRGDLAVYHATSGLWRIQGSRGTVWTQFFGYATAAGAPADYDGDGRADLAVYSQNSGKWSLLRTSAGYVSFVFGYKGTLPIPEDYDGDGRADPAIYRYAKDYTWALLQSTAGYLRFNFGYAGTWPLPADYDGDGKADPAVFSTGNSAKWSIFRTRAGYTSFTFGYRGVLPVRGDYDGDGKVDQAVYDPLSFQWQLRQSRDGFDAMTLGAPNVVPIGSTP